MKKLNAKGFTLIELLAVITIMGILMMVAIPTVSRTIENSRKDTFIDTVQRYVNGAKNMWASDNLQCTVTTGATTADLVASAVPTGTYYIKIDTENADSHPVLLEQGGKSSWGNRNIKGYIRVDVDDSDARKITYYPVLTDGVHGINVDTAGASITEAATLTASENLARGKIVMKDAEYINIAALSDNVCVEV